MFFRLRAPEQFSVVSFAERFSSVFSGDQNPNLVSSALPLRYEPTHPAADETGHVSYPNVNPLIELMDMREAQRSYEANLNVVSSTRRMLMRTLDILKG